MVPVDKDEILDVLSYDRDAGALFWKGTVRNTKAGAKAGFVCGDGYLRIVIRGKRIAVHRIVWLLEGNELPGHGFSIDHIDRNKLNNHIRNLRLATIAENIRNSSTRHDCKSGIRGVSYNAARRKWVANITSDGKLHYLGAFSEIDAAISARHAAELMLFGKFSPLSEAAQ